MQKMYSLTESQEVKSDVKPEKGLFTVENDDGSLTRDLLVPKGRTTCQRHK